MEHYKLVINNRDGVALDGATGIYHFAEHVKAATSKAKENPSYVAPSKASVQVESSGEGLICGLAVRMYRADRERPVVSMCALSVGLDRHGHWACELAERHFEGGLSVKQWTGLEPFALLNACSEIMSTPGFETRWFERRLDSVPTLNVVCTSLGAKVASGISRKLASALAWAMPRPLFKALSQG